MNGFPSSITFFWVDFGTKKLLTSQRVATISFNVAPGLQNLLTFPSVVSEALCTSMQESQSHLYFTTAPLDPKNKLAKQNNHFNNWTTDVFFHKE